jgi:hypothetical protein
MPRLNMNNRAPRDYQLHVRVLQTLNTEEIIPHIELGVNPQVSLKQRHEGTYMQDP